MSWTNSSKISKAHPGEILQQFIGGFSEEIPGGINETTSRNNFWRKKNPAGLPMQMPIQDYPDFSLKFLKIS